MQYKSFGALAYAVAMTAGVVPVAHARAPAAARVDAVRVDIVAQPLGNALVDFAVQANVTIATPRGGFGPGQARALRGAFSAEEGLRRLLAHTSYMVERIDPVTFRIVERVARPERSPPRMAPPGVGEIVVTAARRPRALDRFAASASVIDADSLTRAGIGSTTDLAQGVAGLAFTNLGPGRNKIIVRGLSDGAFSGHTESTIGIYVEDSRITYGAPDPDLKLIDVERAEILRGPQGVLYGGGAIGGIYRITLRAPDLDDVHGFAAASTETTRDGGIGEGVSGMVNLPIVRDRLGLRLVGYHEMTGGWLDNPSLGVENTNSTVREGVRATLLARFDGSWTVTLRALTQGIDSRDSQYTSALAGERRRSTRLLEPHDNDFALTSVTVRGGLPIGEFSSTTSLLHHDYNSRFDATGAFSGLGLDPASVTAFDDENDLRFFVEEARLSGVAAPFPWTMGAFASIGRLKSSGRLTRDALGNAPSTFFAEARADDISEFALFGEATWPIARHVEASFGLRAFRNALSTDAVSLSVASALSDKFSGDRTHTGVSPQFRLSYEPTPDAFYYFQAGNGYRSGGFNAGVGTFRAHVGLVYFGSSSVTFSNLKSLAIGGYTDANIRVGFETPRWRATFYLDNATDADAATFSYGNVFRFGAADLETPLRPRTFGLELARRF